MILQVYLDKTVSWRITQEPTSTLLQPIHHCLYCDSGASVQFPVASVSRVQSRENGNGRDRGESAGETRERERQGGVVEAISERERERAVSADRCRDEREPRRYDTSTHFFAHDPYNNAREPYPQTPNPVAHSVIGERLDSQTFENSQNESLTHTHKIGPNVQREGEVIPQLVGYSDVPEPQFVVHSRNPEMVQANLNCTRSQKIHRAKVYMTQFLRNKNQQRARRGLPLVGWQSQTKLKLKLLQRERESNEHLSTSQDSHEDQTLSEMREEHNLNFSECEVRDNNLYTQPQTIVEPGDPRWGPPTYFCHTQTQFCERNQILVSNICTQEYNPSLGQPASTHAQCERNLVIHHISVCTHTPKLQQTTFHVRKQCESAQIQSETFSSNQETFGVCDNKSYLSAISGCGIFLEQTNQRSELVNENPLYNQFNSMVSSSESNSESDQEFNIESDSNCEEMVTETLSLDQQRDLLPIEAIVKETIERSKRAYNPKCTLQQRISQQNLFLKLNPKVQEYMDNFEVIDNFCYIVEDKNYKPNRLTIGFLQAGHWAETAIKHAEWSFSDSVWVFNSCKFHLSFLFSKSAVDILEFVEENRQMCQWVSWPRVVQCLSCIVYGKSCGPTCRKERGHNQSEQETGSEEEEEEGEEEEELTDSFNMIVWDWLQERNEEHLSVLYFQTCHTNNLPSLSFQHYFTVGNCNDPTETLVVSKEKKVLKKMNMIKYETVKQKFSCLFNAVACGGNCKNLALVSMFRAADSPRVSRSHCGPNSEPNCY